jgi:HK97 family phage prohead protease
MSRIERRFVKGAQVRAKQGDKPAIEGYGSVFNEDYVLYEDSSYRIVERILPGAFGKVLGEKQDTRCLFNHEPDNVLGRTTNSTLRCAQDDTGLHFENDLDMRTTVAQNVQAFVERGDVTGCSFAFTVSKQAWRDEKKDNVTVCTREIEEIDQLYDVGPVTYPAYTGTSVGARSTEMRAQVLAIDSLPAEVRSAMQNTSDGGCSRCAACRRARAAKRDTIGGGTDCQCDCPECMVGDCAHCSEPDCQDPNCNHDGAGAGNGDDDADRSAVLIDIDTRMRQRGMRPIA